MSSFNRHLPFAPRWQIALERGVVLLTFTALQIRAVMQLEHLELPERWQWVDAVLLVVTAVATLLGVARESPGQNVIGAAFVVGLFGTVSHALAARVGIPFGPLVFTQQIGPLLAETVPLLMPCFWIVLVMNARHVVRLALSCVRGGRSRGWWVIGLTAALVSANALVLEPAASRGLRLWLWSKADGVPAWYGVPFTAFVSWFAVAALAGMFISPLLLNKRPGPPPPPSFSPVVLFVGGTLFNGAVCAGSGMRAGAAMGVVLAVLAAIVPPLNARARNRRALSKPAGGGAT